MLFAFRYGQIRKNREEYSHLRCTAKAPRSFCPHGERVYSINSVGALLAIEDLFREGFFESPLFRNQVCSRGYWSFDTPELSGKFFSDLDKHECNYGVRLRDVLFHILLTEA